MNDSPVDYITQHAVLTKLRDWHGKVRYPGMDQANQSSQTVTDDLAYILRPPGFAPEITCHKSQTHIAWHQAVKRVGAWSPLFISEPWKQFSTLHETDELSTSKRSAIRAKAWMAAWLLTGKQQLMKDVLEIPDQGQPGIDGSTSAKSYRLKVRINWASLGFLPDKSVMAELT